MCLEILAKKTGTWNTGWKVFCFYNGRLKPHIESNATRGRLTYPVGKWFKDTASGNICMNYYIYSNGCLINRYYPKGFHYFKSKQAALDWAYQGEVVHKIKARNIVATGTQSGRIVGVAKEIFITKEHVIKKGQEE
jgi:hypothetical protein